MNRIALSALSIATLLSLAPICFSAPQNLAAARKVAPVMKSGDPFLSGPPLTMEQVLKLVIQEAIPLKRRKDAIQSRGVDFTWSAETGAKLKAAGASDELLELIKSKAKPVVAAAPPPKPAPQRGGLKVTCAPAECDVAVNGTPRGATLGGSMELAGPPGSWVIDFTKKGYMSHQSSVVVEHDKTECVSAVLEPDRATIEAFGSALFKKVVEAIGGEEGMRLLGSVEATGSATFWGHEGNSVRWALHMRNRSDRALFEAKAGSTIYGVAFEGREFKASKNLKGQEALDLPTDFAFIRDYQVAAVLERLQGSQYKLSARQIAPTASEEFSLFLESGTEKVAIGLDNELRPQRVRITTGSGVGSVLVTYSDYVKSDKGSYPKSMQIKPEGWRQALDIRFDTVDIDPKLKDTDYKLRTRGLANLWN